MRYRTFGWLLLSMYLAVPQVQGQPHGASLLEDSLFVQRASRGLAYVYDLQFDAADTLFQQLLVDYPGHPATFFLKTLKTWWHILLDIHDTSRDKLLLKQLKAVLKASDQRLQLNREDLDGLFFKGLALSLRARLHANRGHRLKALLDGKRAISYVVRLARMSPENDDFYFGWGIYDYFAAYLPQQYPWLKPLQIFFPEGNRARGLKELQRVFQAGRLFRAEAAYFLLQIHYYYEPDFREAVRYITYLRTRFPHNAYFHALEARVYARWGQWGRVHAVAQAMYDRYQAGAYGYGVSIGEQALYWLGRYAMQKLQYAEARRYFMALDTLSAHRNTSYYRAYGLLRLAMIYDAQGRRPEAIPYYRKVLQMEHVDEAQKRVWQYLRHPYGNAYKKKLPTPEVVQK